MNAKGRDVKKTKLYYLVSERSTVPSVLFCNDEIKSGAWSNLGTFLSLTYNPFFPSTKRPEEFYKKYYDDVTFMLPGEFFT